MRGLCISALLQAGAVSHTVVRMQLGVLTTQGEGDAS